MKLVCISPVKIKYKKWRPFNESAMSKLNTSRSHFSLKPNFCKVSSFDEQGNLARVLSTDYEFTYYNNTYTTNKELEYTSSFVIMYVDCGKCYACRVKKSNEWAMRLSQELFENDSKGVFTTLTYSEENYPVDGCLDKEHLQKFQKRLRYHINRLCKEEKIKIFSCGEYGSNTNRAHYHAIVTGYKYLSSTKIKKCIDKAWSFKSGSKYVPIGFTKHESANSRTVAYVCKYMCKDIGLSKDKDTYEKYYKRVKPFRLMSKSIGKTWFFKNMYNILENGYIPHFGYKLPIPRTYIRWLKQYLGTEKVYNELEKRFFEYKKMEFDLLSIQLGVELNTNFLYEDEIYNLCNQPLLLEYYFSRLKEYKLLYKQKEQHYIEQKRLKALKNYSVKHIA